MPISQEVMKSGLEVFIASLKKELLPIAKVRMLEEQRAKYDETISHIMKRDGTSREEVVARIGDFVPDEEEAEKSFHGYVDNGIAYRLGHAIDCYHADNHVQCIRCIILAMETLVFLDGSGDSAYHRLHSLDLNLLKLIERRF